MKVEFVHPSHLEDPAKAQLSSRVVPVVRVEELRAFLRDIDYADLPYETIRAQAKRLLASLPEGV